MSNSIRVFVSHKETDETSAHALIRYLLAAMYLEQEEIMCTSVPGYNRVPFGSTLHEALRDSVSNSPGFIALLTEDSLESTWVTFELGAAWALTKAVVPILGPGIGHKDARLGPISSMRCVPVDSKKCETNMRDAISQISSTLGISLRGGGAAEAELSNFIDTFKKFGAISAAFDKSGFRIEAPLSETIVISPMLVTIVANGVPDGGYLWLFVENEAERLLWPKDSLPQQDGKHVSTISEDGTIPPGAASIVLVGVGVSGNDMINQWFTDGAKTGSFPGLREAAIPGFTRLHTARGLTIKKKRKR